MSYTLRNLRVIFSVFIIHSPFSIEAQNIHFSNISENLFVQNPATITRTENIVFQLCYRNQWPGAGNFTTYDGAFFIHSEPLKSTAGILILRDIQGDAIITSTSFGILYGYKARIARTWFLAGGIHAAYNLYSINYSQLTFENGQYPALLFDDTQYFFDFSTGLELSYKDNSRYGVSVSRLGSFQPALNSHPGLQINLSYQGKYLMNTDYDKNIIKIEPSFYAAIQHRSSEILYGSRMDIGGILGGIYFRQNYQFEFDAIIILLGTRFGNMSFFYCYDINLSGADSRFTNLAAHEVTFLYDMQYNRKRNERGAIKCPKI